MIKKSPFNYSFSLAMVLWGKKDRKQKEGGEKKKSHLSKENHQGKLFCFFGSLHHSLFFVYLFISIIKGCDVSSKHSNKIGSTSVEKKAAYLSVCSQNTRYLIIHRDRPRLSGNSCTTFRVHLENAICGRAPHTVTTCKGGEMTFYFSKTFTHKQNR